MAAVAQQREHVTVQLDPADLGRVDVALRVDGSGHLHASFAVERPETLQLLQSDVRGLEQTLAGGGLQLAGGGLSFGLRRDGGGGQGTTGGGEGHRPRGVGSAADGPSAGQSARAGPRRRDRMLDLSV